MNQSEQSTEKKKLSNENVKAVSGVVWKFSERIIAQVVSMVVSIILARLLNPQDYSVVSLVAIFFAFSDVLISGGLNSALIQKKDADEKDYSTVLTFSLILSAVVYGILFFSAPAIAAFYRQEILIMIIRVMGITIPITAIKSIWCAYISSHLQFRKFFFATIGGTVVSAGVGIWMAYSGYGPWALVAQQMTNTLTDTVILILSTRINAKPVLHPNRFKTLFRYGWKVLVTSLVGQVYRQIVPLFIGAKYDSTDLSFYTKGRSFPELLSSTATSTLSAVLFPVLAKHQDSRSELLKYTRAYIKLASLLAFPMMAGFFMVSESFVTVLLTEKWLPAVPYMRVFCAACMFEMVHVGNNETIKAMGRSDIHLVMEIIKKAGYFLTILIFLFTTSTPYKLSYAFLVCQVIALTVNCIPNRSLIGYSFAKQAEDLLPNLLLALLMCVPIYFVGRLPIPTLWILLLQIPVGMITYLLLNLVTRNPSFRMGWELIRSYLKTVKRK